MNIFKTSLITLLISFYTFCIAQNREWQCINEQGNVVFTLQARWVSNFSNGLASIKTQEVVNNKWVTKYGFVNKSGSIVIPCIYDKVNDFNTNVTWVKKKADNYYILIDKSGNIIPTKHYKKVGNFYKNHKDVCAVYEDNKIGFINNAGKEIVPCKYLGSSTFEEGLSCVTAYDGTVEKYGFIDKTGTVVIPFQYRQAGSSSFNNGECRVTVSGKTVLINKKGEIIFKTKYKSLQNFNHGLAAVSTKPDRTGWGFVNRNDKWIVKPIYDYVTSFNEDAYAIVEKNNLKGAIDTTGRLILPMKYETIYIEPTKDGRICAVLPSKTPVSLLNAKKEYFDKDFHKITLNNILYLSNANGGNLMKFTALNKRLGYMNRKFEVVIPATYKKAFSFSEGLAWVRK